MQCQPNHPPVSNNATCPPNLVAVIHQHMSFFVDIVTEDSFYENLTIGVVKLLEASPCVKHVKVERRSACDRSALSSWEQRHGCLLPEDLKSFYASIDGFSLTWSLDIAGKKLEMKYNEK